MTTETKPQPETENRQLAMRNGSGGGNPLSIYQQFRDPMIGINQLAEFYAKSGMVRNPGEAGVLAFACFFRGEDPLTMTQQYMVVNGRLTRNYDMLLVDLRNAGGDFKWITEGDDEKKASLQISWRGETNVYTFTIEKAAKEGLANKDNWKRMPSEMLRSKAVRRGLTMYAPEVSAGVTTPEDAYDYPSDIARQAELERQREEIRSMAAAPVQQTATQAAAPTSEAEEEVPFEVEKTEAATEPQPEQNGNAKVTGEKLQELAGIAQKLGMTGQQVKAEICKAASVTDPAEITMAQCEKMIEKLHAELLKRTATTAATPGN